MSIRAILFFVVAMAKPFFGLPGQDPTQPANCTFSDYHTCYVLQSCDLDTTQADLIGPVFHYEQIGSQRFSPPSPIRRSVASVPDSNGCNILYNGTKAFESLGPNPPVVQKLYLDVPFGECERDFGPDACLWLKVAYTQYRVYPKNVNELCNGKPLPESVDVRFPNVGNEGGGFYCRVGEDACSVDDELSCWNKEQ